MSDKSTSRFLLVALGALISAREIFRQAVGSAKAAVDSLAAKGEANQSAVDELIAKAKKEVGGLVKGVVDDAKAAFNEEVHEMAKKVAEATESPPKPKEGG